MASDGDRLVRAFESEIPPVPVSLVYRLGLAVVAIVMLVLPLIYIGLIGAVCYGLYYHATVNSAIFNTEGSAKGKVFVFVAPLIIGAILVLFMIKPLFARRPKQAEPVSLDKADEPALFAFVARLCEVVGAPFPQRIDVDHQVNASASFRRGFLSLLSNDLVLTIGLPLVAGMSLRQLTGVLAHEFGHFAQGGGMRLTYVIRSINGWFARVVYERDAWDVRLEHWAKDIDFRLGIILHTARFFVWLTRKILWVLMMAGHAVSCFMMRQMEFDADRYEARVSGSETFESTAIRLQVLGIASQRAYQALDASWGEGKLADDLPCLIHSSVDRLPPDLNQRIAEHIGESKTGAFDTHPADSDRIASAKREQAEGVFRLQEPATTLFSDFEAVCKKVTLAYYREQLEGDVPRERLVPVSTLLAEQREADSWMEALHLYFQGALSDQTMFWPGTPAPAGNGRDAVAEARSAMERLAPALETVVARAEDVNDKQTRAAVAQTLMKAKFKIEAAAFKLNQASEAGVEEAMLTAGREREQVDGSLSEFHEAASRRLKAAQELIVLPEVTGKIEGAQELAREMQALVATLAQMRPVFDELEKFHREHVSLRVLLENASDDQDVDAAREIGELSKSQLEFLGRLQSLEADHPFEGDGVTIGKHAVPELPQFGELGPIYHAGDQAKQRLYSVYFRTLGKLVETAMRVETALGMPAPKPPQQSTESPPPS